MDMKCWNWAFIAQGLRVIREVVEVEAVKIYVAPVQALTKKETQDETQFTTKIGGKTSLGPSLYNFHSQLCVWCPITLKLAVLAP
jgi:hypothetical protein